MSNTESEITTRQLYEEIVRNRSELKNSIEASEARLLMKIESLNNKIRTLEKEKLELSNKVELLERESKKKNLVIFGLNRNPREVSAASICREIKQLLNVQLIESDISNIFTLGNVENSPIKLELVSYLKKREILQNCHKLKGTKTYIVHDLTEKQRSDNKILRTHLHQAREHTKDSYIKGNRLYVNSIEYKVEDLLYEEDSKQKNNSAPPTPSAYNNPTLDSELPVNLQSQTNAEEDKTNKEEHQNTPKTGTVKKTNRQTAVTLSRDGARGRLRSNK